jgi:deazaflavin-dependent oxidoreductase (nitroreductase family)
MPLPRALARFNRRATNKVLGPLAKVSSPFAIVVHAGRRSGREYRTPVWAFRRGGNFVIALTYGPRTEWVKNVLDGGRAEIASGNDRFRVTQPRIVSGEEGMNMMPAVMRPALRLLRVDRYLLLRVEDRGGLQPALHV